MRLIDAGPIDGDGRHLAALSRARREADGVLFVVDQDLRAPEVAALARLAAGGKPLYVVLNKADQFNAADRDAILLSIRAKMPANFAPGSCRVGCRRAHSGRTRDRRRTRRGADRIAPAVERRRSPDEPHQPRHPAELGRTLQFEAALVEECRSDARSNRIARHDRSAAPAVRRLAAAPAGAREHREGNARDRGFHRQARKRPRRDCGVRRSRVGQERAAQRAGRREDLRGFRRARLHRQNRQDRIQEHQAGPGRYAGHQRSRGRAARQARRGDGSLHRPGLVRRRRRPQPGRARRLQPA